jgi:hypothetical protein
MEENLPWHLKVFQPIFLKMCLVIDGKCNIHSNKLFANGKKRIGVRVIVVAFQHTNAHKFENI